jgi:Carboxypeptidase regulatory-like domain
MGRFATIIALLLSAVLIPTIASAQGSIAGVVTDTSGAVLPGVTVEVASPALIEKVRSAVTDGTGQYQIVNLPPGGYTVTFTLAGFNTLKREGIELTGNFTATVNGTLRVGALEETVTVTGEAPIVDVQNTARQRIVDRDIIENIPAGRNIWALGALNPGITTNVPQDVGGAVINATTGMSSHGGRSNDGWTSMDGITMNAMASTGFTTRLIYSLASVQEVTLDYSANTADVPTGGVRINIVPREGGNTLNGTFFSSIATHAMQAANLTDDLRRQGLRTPDAVKKLWDVNPGFGGPIRQNKIWFYVSALYSGSQLDVADMFFNKNANNPNAWTYEPDLNRPAFKDTHYYGGDARLTWQVSPRNKIGILAADQAGCTCVGVVSATVAPEADIRERFPIQRRQVLDWTSPATNRLLLEAGVANHFGRSVRLPALDTSPKMITVNEQSTGLRYRSADNFRNGPNHAIHMRFGASYITGAHAYKAGFTHSHGYEARETSDGNQSLTYRFNNGVPNLITQRALPLYGQVNVDHNLAIYAQDKWSVGHLTASYGLRYDYFASSFPVQRAGPAVLAPTRDITFPVQKNTAWHDLSPRLGLSYDPTGNGKTAIKVSLNRYLQNEAAGSPLAADPSPLNTLVTNTTRSWNDANRNFVPDCDLISPLGNGECGAMANPAFGSARPGAAYDPDLLRGWDKRTANWEFSAGAQRELFARTSVDVAYFRRAYQNFWITDNRAVSASDFDRFSITAPSDPRLPGGGSYTVSGLYDLKPTSFGRPADNFVTLASKYGKQVERWQGVDVNLSMRPQAGLRLQGGVSTGRTLTDICDVAEKVPEMLLSVATPANATTPQVLAVSTNNTDAIRNQWIPAQYCRQSSPFLTNVKFAGSYTIPRADVLVSGTFRSVPGPEIYANYTATNAVIQPSLGRVLSGGVANLPVTIVEPGTMYGERLNQVDMRFGKILRFGRTKTVVNLDVYNLFNVNNVLTVNYAYATWLRPTSILLARFAKIGVQFDF